MFHSTIGNTAINQEDIMVFAKINNLMGSIGENNQYWTWTLFRVITSAMFTTHGYAKLFVDNPQPMTGGGITNIIIGDLISVQTPMDINTLFVAGVIEFGAGLLVLIGLYTHIAAFLSALLMLMAYLTTHLAWFPTFNNGELAAMYFLAYLVIFTYGAGPYSADSWLALRRQKKRQSKLEKNFG